MRLLISAAEPSGDRLGSELIAALRARLGNREPLELVGVGGPQMQAAGVQTAPGAAWVEPAMGVVEVLRHLRAIRRNRDALVAAATGVDVFVGIDAPDYHLGVARAVRARGVRAIGYVSPQLWAWRPGRAGAVAASADRLLCLFRFEPALYAGTGLDAVWVGHPAVDRVRPSAREPGVLAIFPGSRAAEVRRHLDVFLDAARRLSPQEILVAEAPGTTLPPMPASPGGPPVRVVPGPEALARADRALSKSGTVTLELALAGIPTLVAHRVHPLTYLIGRALVRGVRHLALPNVLAGEEVVPELVQHFDAELLARRWAAAPVPPVERLRALLGDPGVADRAAEAVLEVVRAGRGLS